jgi:hypothetical protein
MQFNVGDKIKDRRTGLLGEVIQIRVSHDTYPLNVRVPENVLRKNSDGYDCPETYWCAPHELIQLTPQEPAEGDFERMERTQEQAARLRDAAEQDQYAEPPFGEHWQKLMRQHSKTELIAALKTALYREQSHKEARMSAYTKIDQLRAKIAKQTRVMEWAKTISLSLSQNPSFTPEEAAILKVHHGIIFADSL